MQRYKNGSRYSVDVYDSEGYKVLIKNITIKDYGKRIGRLFDIVEDHRYVIGCDPYGEGEEGTTVIDKREGLNNPTEVVRQTYKIAGNELR